MAPDFEVAIIGTGFAGLAMAIQLVRRGQRGFVIFEKSEDLGGAWRDNHYPGCACDVPAHLYSYSFAPNPDWTRTFAPQREILAYLARCADAYGIRPHVRFGAEVQRAEFDAGAGCWRVDSAGGTVTARHLVAGVGALSRPAIPALPGIERFAGRSFHSARWDHGFDFAGKRVAVVGTGASAIQFVPAIAERAAQLDLYQRTPPWVLPHPDRATTRLERAIFRALPALQRLYRYGLYWRHEALALGFIARPGIMRVVRRLGEWNIRRAVADPALRARLTPDYLPGCKRVLMSNRWYPALARPNVAVVSAAIGAVTPRGIVDAAGVERPADAIVYGTGFDVQGFLAPIRIFGLGGVELHEIWRRAGMQAYRGTTVAGFPNFFTLTGPNTGLGHSSMVFMIEAQVEYILREIDALAARGARSADVQPSAQAAYNAALEPRLARSVWATGCKSWYLDDQGRNAALWPGFTFEFWWKSRRFAPEDHRFDPAGPPDDQAEEAER